MEAACRYASASKEVKNILREYDAAASSYSLDEAFLDVTDYCEANGLTGKHVVIALSSRALERA